jgi:hypothetical protein
MIIEGLAMRSLETGHVGGVVTLVGDEPGGSAIELVRDGTVAVQCFPENGQGRIVLLLDLLVDG